MRESERVCVCVREKECVCVCDKVMLDFVRMGDHFAELLHILNMMSQWYLNVGNSCQINYPTLVDQVLGGYVVKRLTKIDRLYDSNRLRGIHNTQNNCGPKRAIGSFGIVYLQQNYGHECF